MRGKTRARGICVRTTLGGLRQHWWEVIGTFLKVGALNYGGTSVGIIQTEVQEKRGWVSKAQFLEGLALGGTRSGVDSASWWRQRCVW